MIKDDVDYYVHQLEGVRWMARVTSNINADDMGLGKTLQALTTAAIDFEKGWATRVLVVCPATLKGNWEEEIADFTNFTAMILDGTPPKREELLDEFETGGFDILVINYEQVKPHLARLNALGFDIVIYDEAHYIKNHTSQRTQAAHGLHGRRHILLTGSPMLNHVDDLWALLYRVAPGDFPNYYRFVSRYAVFGGYKDKQIIGVKNERELKERLHGFMIRREKTDVLDLPDKQVIPVRVDLHPKQRKVYDQANDELMIERDSGDIDEFDNPLVKFTRLKQICATLATLEMEDVSAKLDKAMEMIEEFSSNGHKVVVFTQFRPVLACLDNRLSDAKWAGGVPRYQIHGDIPKQARQGVVRTWSAEPGPAVISGMIQVAGTGLNMTAARHGIFIDRLFVPKLNEQGEDRLYRIGADLTQPVQIFNIIARNTVEQRIESILRRKTKIFGAVVDESDFKRKLIRALLAKESDDE